MNQPITSDECALCPGTSYLPGDRRVRCAHFGERSVRVVIVEGSDTRHCHEMKDETADDTRWHHYSDSIHTWDDLEAWLLGKDLRYAPR